MVKSCALHVLVIYRTETSSNQCGMMYGKGMYGKGYKLATS